MDSCTGAGLGIEKMSGPLTRKGNSRQLTISQWIAIVLLSFAGTAIRAHAQSAPPNDDLANAQVVTGSNFIVTGADTGGTRENGEPAVTGYNTIWYLWTAPANLNVTLTLSGTSNGVVVSAFQSGTAGQPSYNTLNFITANNSSSGGTTASISFAATANTTYAFAIGAQTSGYPNGALNLSLAGVAGNPVWAGPVAPTSATPANDNLANAQVLTGSNLIAVGYDASATNELGEPAVTGDNTLWYVWTAPANLNVVISLAGSYNGVALSAFQTGVSGTCTYNTLNFITGNSSYNGGVTPSISFAATANTTYVFAIGAYASGNPNGTLMMTLTSSPGGALWVGPAAPVSDAPLNDDLANAQILTGTGFQAIGYDGSASVELGEPALTGFNTLWYQWTAPASAIVRLTL
ncbi:MAG TPA: hypothetical protein VHY22_00500, partial [Chthoniobacteraceae bacterium]|nr:hypothetical protein [Chthoniobacteraceae bacterium]